MKKIFLLLFFYTCLLYAQRDSLVMNTLGSARTLMESGKHQEAHQQFRMLFSMKKIIPNEAAYWYGVNLFHLTKNAASKAAFKKYLKISGDTGLHFIKTQEYLAKLDCKETGYKEVVITCEICYGDTILVECHHCKGKGLEVCPVCKGNGVVSSQGAMGRTFHTCSRCQGEKVLSCSVCKGQKKVRDICQSCNGTGRLKVKRKCED
ncbi:MAG: hypothetical protein MUF42_00985 [Cytophagaceae bacterium]|nr:hypothetical protein [Cytophagaceae bacterium]